MTRATSIVMVNLQRPMTIFGLPPRLMILAMAGAAVLNAALVITGQAGLSFLAGLVTFAVGAMWAWRLARRDCHCETVMFMPLQWWRGRPRRRLITGIKR